MADNRTRILAEALAVDAWHQPFKVDSKTAAVHVELSFKTGRVGGNDPTVPFTFNVSLKRAILTIKLEHPLEVVRSSIARHIPVEQTERVTITTARDTVKNDAAVRGRMSLDNLSAAIAGSHTKIAETTREDQFKFLQTIPRIVVKAIPIEGSGYSWELTPGREEVLSGQAWDPVEEPRLSVKSFVPNASMDPSIRIFVTCALEDIAIDDLRPKKDGILDRLTEYVINDINYKAAVHHLKTILHEAELEIASVSSQFSQLIIADVLAVVE